MSNESPNQENFSLESELLKEQSPKKKEIFVEIGPGDLPSINGNYDFKDTTYIGVENGNNSFFEGSKGAVSLISKMPDDKKEGKYIIEANGDKLPLEDSSVDRVFFRNVLGDPQTWGRVQLMQEAARVLKIGGILVIFEDYTPFEGLQKLHGQELTDFLNKSCFDNKHIFELASEGRPGEFPFRGTAEKATRRKMREDWLNRVAQDATEKVVWDERMAKFQEQLDRYGNPRDFYDGKEYVFEFEKVSNHPSQDVSSQ